MLWGDIMGKIKCPLCDKEFEILNKHIRVHGLDTAKFKEMFPDLPLKSGELSKKFSEDISKRWTDELKSKVGNTMKEIWNKEEYKNKQSISRSKALKECWKDPNFRESRSQSIRKSQTLKWKDSNYRYNQVESFKRKWQNPEYRKKMINKFSNVRDFVRSDGIIVKMRSSWEVRLSELLDNLEIKWEYEPRAFEYFYNNAVHNYIPDFFLSSEKMFLEVKAEYYLKAKNEKYKRLCVQLKGYDIYYIHEEHIKDKETLKQYLDSLQDSRLCRQ